MGINSVMLKKCVSFGGSEDVHDLKLETWWSRPQKLAKTIPKNQWKTTPPRDFDLDPLSLRCCYSSGVSTAKTLGWWFCIWILPCHGRSWVTSLLYGNRCWRVSWIWLSSDFFSILYSQCHLEPLRCYIYRVACGEMLTLDHPKPPFLTYPIWGPYFLKLFPSASSCRKSVQGMWRRQSIWHHMGTTERRSHEHWKQGPLLWTGYIRDYTTQLYGDYNRPL